MTVTTFDNDKIIRLKQLIDRRWALAKTARQHAPRIDGFMSFIDMARADEKVEPEQDEIRRQAAAIAPRPLSIRNPVDAAGNPVKQDELDRVCAPVRHAYEQHKAAKNLVLSAASR